MLSKRSNGKTGTVSPWDNDPFLWEPLEQRLLLSADSVGAVIGDGAVLSILDREQQEDAVDLEALVNFLDQKPSVEASQDRSPTPLPYAVDLEPLANLTGANAPAEPAADTLLTWLSDSETRDSADPGADAAEQRNEILFLDTRTPDHQQLLDGIARGSADTSIEIVLLDPDRDGIQQISDVLAGHAAVDAIHIVSHGAAGTIQLGDGWLSQENLAGYASAIEDWSEALSNDADLLIYGCSLAANDQGQALIRSLSEITGADVAASKDATGSQALGGDWILEYTTGSITSTLPLNAQFEHDWSGVLAVYTVTNTNDSGAGSLEEAITLANGNGGADEIHFNIPLNDPNHFYYENDGIADSLSLIATTGLDDGTIGDFDPDYPGAPYSWFSIKPTNILPAITDPLIIDGTTQPGYAGKPIIELDGTSVSGGDSNALTIQGGDSTVRGLVINRFVGTDADAIEIEINGGNTVAGNYIGTDVTGTKALGNVWGINLKSVDNIVGGTTDADRNVISGNLFEGIYIYTANATGNLISGNYIGVDATGTAPLGNLSDGVYITNSAGNTSIVGNLISGNSGYGIAIEGGVGGNVIEGNYIGTDVYGLADLGNTLDGIHVYDAPNNRIGGAAPGSGNLISGNDGWGVQLEKGDSTGNQVFGNLIGTDIKGTGDLGNFSGGVKVKGSATGNLTGGNNPGEGNLIAFNDGEGVNISGGSNRIRANVMFDNGGATDDIILSGGNGGADMPSVSGVSSGGGTTDVTVSLTGADADDSYLVDLFSNPSNEAEGEVYLGTVTLTTDGSGNASQSFTLTTEVLNGHYVTATASNIASATSGFSPAISVAGPSGVNTAPLIDPTVDVVLSAVSENAGPPTGVVGTLIEDLVDLDPPAGGNDNISDPDGGAVTGIAIIAADTTNGTWFYSTDNGSNWSLFGAVSIDNARLLAADETTRIYFQPNPGFSGTVPTGIHFRAWDQTSGTNGNTADTSIHGGTSAFSLIFDSASILVSTGANAIPVFEKSGPFSLDENSADLTVVGNVDANDGDGGAADAGITYTITTNVDPDGDGTDAFSIDSNGVIRVQDTGDLDYESDTSLTISVQADDGFQQSITDIDIDLNPLNDNAPVVTSASSANVAENATAVLQITASDDDLPGDTLSFSIAGSGADDALFDIDGAGNLSFIAAPDYELPADNGGDNGYQVDVAVFDGVNTTVQRIDVTVTRENDNDPVVTSADTANVAENTTAVHKVTATDADLPGDTLNFSIAGSGADDALFSIDAAGNLRFIAAPDFELPADKSGNNVHHVDVAVFDGANTTVKHIHVTVTDENDEAPMFTADGPFNLDENSAVSTITGNVDANDGDGGAADAGITYSITANTDPDGDGTDAFSIDPTGMIRVQDAGDLDYESDTALTITVQADDGIRQSTADIDININPLNDNAPVVVSADTASVMENNTAVHKVTASDADLPGDTLSFGIAGSGADDTLFSIDAAGNLRFITAPDYELPADVGGNNLYQVDVAVFDGAYTTVQRIDVTVTAENDNTPTVTSAGTASVAENSTAIHQVTATDADLPGDTLSFGIAGTGADDALFSIDAAGNLSFIAAPDFELPANAGGDNVYQVDVAVFDGANTTVQRISVTVTGVNEAPQIDLGIPGSTVSVDTGTSQIIDVDASDVDDSDLTYSIRGTDTGVLEIDPVTGALSFQSESDYTAPVDADGNNVYTVTVTVSDGTNSVSQPLTVIVRPEATDTVSPPVSNATVDIKVDRMVDDISLDFSTKTTEAADETQAEKSEDAEQGLQEPGKSSPTSFGSGVIPPETPDTDVDAPEPDTPPKIDIDTGIKDSNKPATEWKRSLVTLIAGTDPLELLAKRGFLDGLDEMRDDAEDRLNLNKAMIGSTVALSTGLSVGYVAWLIRSGALLSGLLTSLPAWQFVDPMPVLAFGKKQSKQDQDDDDSLESMVSASDEEEVTDTGNPQQGLPLHENQ